MNILGGFFFKFFFYSDGYIYECLNGRSAAALLLLPKLDSNRIQGFSTDWVARE